MLPEQKGEKDKMKQNELWNRIHPLIKGKDVLDVGCVEHTVLARLENPFWIHNFLNDNCNVLGIDLLKEEVIILKDLGYNIEVADAETFNLNKKFDVVFEIGRAHV